MWWMRFCATLLLVCLVPLLALAEDEDPFGDDSDAAPAVQEEDIFSDLENDGDSADPFGDDGDQAAGAAVPAPPTPKPDAGAEDPVVAHWESLLDRIHQIDEQGSPVEDALPLAKEALAIADKHFGPDSADTGLSVTYLADTYASLGKYAAAEPLYGRAIKIYKKAHGGDSLEYADGLFDLAFMYHDMMRYADAVALYEKSHAIAKEGLGNPGHPDLAIVLNNLAAAHFRQGQLAKAEELQKQAISAYANAEEVDELEEAFYLIGLVQIQRAMGKYPLRTWTDDSGQHRREGAFVGFDGGKVKMKLKGGKASSVPLSRLSQADKDYVLLEWSASPAATASDIRALLTAQADINAIDQHGWTPLHLAAFHGSDPKILSVLVAAGADPLAYERTDVLAADWAYQNPKMRDTPEYQKLVEATEKAREAIPMPPTPKPDQSQ